MNLPQLIHPAYAIVCNPILKDCTQTEKPKLYINNFISGLIAILMIVGLLYFLWHFVFAGYHLISSEGDSKKYEDAKNELTNALIGLIAIFSVFAILRVVGIVLGIPGLGNLEITWPTL